MKETLKNILYTGIGIAFLTKEKVEELKADLIEKGKMSQEEGRQFVDDLLRRSEKARDQLDLWINKRVEERIAQFDLATRDELADLGARSRNCRWRSTGKAASRPARAAACSASCKLGRSAGPTATSTGITASCGSCSSTLNDLVDRLHIDQYLESGLQMINRKPREQIARLSRPERLRLVFEELGPTFIKLGQLLSTRPDLIPADYLDELARLQDEVPAFSLAEVHAIFREELGRSPDEVFHYFDAEPLAAASIGQVHRSAWTAAPRWWSSAAAGHRHRHRR